MLAWIRRVFQKFASQSARDSVQHQEGQERPNSRKFSLVSIHSHAPEPYPPPTLLNIPLTHPSFLGLYFSVCLHVCFSYSAAAAAASLPPLEHARPFCRVSLLWDFLCCSGFLQTHLLASHPDFQIPAPVGSILSSCLLSHPCHSEDPDYGSWHFLLPHIALTTFCLTWSSMC